MSEPAKMESSFYYEVTVPTATIETLAVGTACTSDKSLQNKCWELMNLTRYCHTQSINKTWVDRIN